jgi:hypothetical protein
MPIFPDAFRQDLAGVVAPTVFAVVDIDFPAGAGGRLRISEDAPNRGTYGSSNRALAGGLESVQVSVSPRVSDLGAPRSRAEVADTDNLLSTILSGRYDCRRAPVTARWIHGVTGNECVMFTGILDEWSLAGKKVTLQFATDDRVLRGFVPRRQILKGWAPNAPAPSLSVYCPIVLGIHNAQGLVSSGMVTAIPISIDATTGYKYLVSLGTMKSIPRVYKNGTLQTVGTHYNVAQESRGGLSYTYVGFVSATASTDVVTCDVEGLTENGLTSGAVILNPADQVKWVLHNVVYGDWSGGAYLSGAPIDAQMFATTAAYCSLFKYEGAKRIGGTTDQDTGLSLMNEWLRSGPMLRFRWSNLGKLGPFVIDHRFAPYAAAYLFDGGTQLAAGVDDVDRSFGFRASSNGIISKVSMQYLYGEAPGKYWQKLEVQDLRRWQIERITESFTFPWSTSRFQ